MKRVGSMLRDHKDSFVALISLVALVVSIGSCGVSVQQARLSGLGVQAVPEVVETFSTRGTRDLSADGHFIIVCRAYLFVSNRGGQATNLVNAHVMTRVGAGPPIVTAWPANLDISEPIGVSMWESDHLGVLGFQASHVYVQEDTSLTSSFEEEMVNRLTPSLSKQLQDDEWDLDAETRAAAQRMVLDLLRANAFDGRVPSNLPIDLPAGSVTRVVVESIFFPLQVLPKNFRDEPISQSFVLGLSSTPPIRHTTDCEDTHRIKGVDL